MDKNCETTVGHELYLRLPASRQGFVTAKLQQTHIQEAHGSSSDRIHRCLEYGTGWNVFFVKFKQMTTSVSTT